MLNKYHAAGWQIPGLFLKLNRTLCSSWAQKPFYVTRFLFVGKRLQPP